MGIMRVPDEQQIRRRADAAPTPATYALDWTDPAAVKDLDVLDFIVGQYDDGKARRQEWEKNAALQLAWVRGNQDTIWSDELRDLVRSNPGVDVPIEFRDPISVNRLRGFVMAYLALTIVSPLTWEVQAATRDDDDVAAARLAAKLLRYYFRAGDIDGTSRLLDALWMMHCTGIVWIKPVWDPKRGSCDRFSADALRQPGETEQSTQQRKKLLTRFQEFVGKANPRRKLDQDADTIDLPAGEIWLDYASGFDITEPAYCRNVEEAAWLIHSRFRTVEYVREHYGSVADDIVADGDSEAYHRRFNEQYGTWSAYEESRSYQAPSDEVLVHELWRPHSESAPLGFLGVVAAEKVMHKGPHPYMHGRLPYIALREAPDPEHFRPHGQVHDLIPIQRARNKHRSQIHGYVQCTVQPKILVEDGSGCPDDAFTGGPKQIPLSANGIDKIKAWEPPRAPPELFRLDQMDNEDMEAVAGIHRSTAGQAEFGGQSGKHAQMMQQQDSRQRTVTRLLLEGAFSKAGQQMLWLGWEFVSKARTMAVPGSDAGEYDVVTWNGKRLAPKNKPFGPFAFNVSAKMGTERDERATVMMVAGLTKGGWLRPENEADKRLVLRWLGEQVPTELDEHALHRANAAAENEELREGKVVKAALGDEDGVHLDAHLRFTTRSEYRTASASKPEIDEHMRVHIREHYLQQALKQYEPIALAKVAQVHLIKEYGLAPSKGPATPPGAGGQAPQQGAMPGGRPAAGGQATARPVNGAGGGPTGNPAGSAQPAGRF